MVDDLAGEWVGPMPMKKFIETRVISAGNVLMREDGGWGGFLNDWDLATHVKEDAIAHQFSCPGTWPFMSIALLETPGKINTLQDDLESFFWVVLYHALRYMVHSLKLPNELKEVMKKISDEEHGVVGEAARGGTCKRVLFVFRKPLGHKFAMHENIPLTNFIDTILDSWRQLHVDDYERRIAKTENTYDTVSRGTRWFEILSMTAMWPCGTMTASFWYQRRSLRWINSPKMIVLMIIWENNKAARWITRMRRPYLPRDQ